MTASHDRQTTLRITEVYASVQGEGTHAGVPTVFVRLTGCNLRCVWCDSEYTFTGGVHRELDALVAEVASHGLRTVQVTGGEPLAQRAAIPLMQRLVDEGHDVLLETSGSLSIEDVPDGVHVVLDLKCPDSGEVEANLWSNLEHLGASDEIKFVVASRQDYEWSVAAMREHGLGSLCTVLISPAWGLVDPAEVSAWMVADKLEARLNLQIHKVIWPAADRGV